MTTRRVTSQLGVTQPVLYSAFTHRQALIDAVALSGFTEIAEALEAADGDPMARMRAYLGFASARPHLYEAMFSMPSDLGFGTASAPKPLHAPSRRPTRSSPAPTTPEGHPWPAA